MGISGLYMTHKSEQNKYLGSYIHKMKLKYGSDIDVFKKDMEKFKVNPNNVICHSLKSQSQLKINLQMEWNAACPWFNYSDYITVQYQLCEIILAKIRIQLWMQKLNSYNDNDPIVIEI